MKESLPSVRVMEPTEKPVARLQPAYKVGLAVLASLEILLSVFSEMSQDRGQLSFDTVTLAGVLGFLLGQMAIFFILASIATAIAALMTKMNWGVLFAKSLFFVMLLIVPFMAFVQLML